MTYIDTKRILPYQKGGDLWGFTKQFLQGFSDVLPPNVTSEQVKFQRYNARFDDAAELENGYKFDDNQKVSAHIVGDKKVQTFCIVSDFRAHSFIVYKLIRKRINPWNFDQNLESSNTGDFEI